MTPLPNSIKDHAMFSAFSLTDSGYDFDQAHLLVSSNFGSEFLLMPLFSIFPKQFSVDSRDSCAVKLQFLSSEWLTATIISILVAQ